MTNNPYFTDRGGVLYCEDVALPQIAETYGTPTYVYSAGHIRMQYQNLRGAMDAAGVDAMICYACKANSNLAILSLLRSLGCGLEIVSEGELVRGLKAGFAPEHIVSTGVGKTRSEIEAQLRAGIHQINVESLAELEHIQAIAAEIDIQAKIVLRLNPNIAGGGHDKISTGRKGDKFGLPRADVFKGFAMAKEMSHVEAVGLSVHIGSQVFEVEQFEKAFAQLPQIVEDLRAEGFCVERLDIGGGFPIQYDGEDLLDLAAYAQWVKDIIVPLGVQIVLEPGRYLVGNAGVLLSRVSYMKEADGHNFAIIDGSMSELVRPAMYDAYHGVEVVTNRHEAKQTYDIVGPVCESSDIFGRGRELPKVTQGDLVAVMTAGAYGFSMASHYNTRCKPTEILIDGDKIAVIHARESYDDLLRGEQVPDWI